MELAKQVVSLPIAQRLKKLGVRQQSYFRYGGKDGDLLLDSSDDTPEFTSDTYAFTVAEMGEILPESFQYGGTLMEIFQYKSDGEFCLEYRYFESEKIVEFIHEQTEADARGKMLIYLLEQGLIKL